MTTKERVATKDADDDMICRSFHIDVKAINLEARSVDVVASTDAIDAHGEIVDQSWILDRYEANPVVLYNHNREGWMDSLEPEYTLPIGHAENVKVTKGRLEATLFFVDEKASPMAPLVWQGFVQKSLRAVSVGFKSKNIRTEMADGIEVYRLMDNELFEISCCPMGSNPEAVRKSIEAEHKAFAAVANKHTSAAPATKEQEMTTEQIEALRAEHEKAIVAERAKAAEFKALAESKVVELAAKTTEVSALTSELTQTKAASDKLAGDFAKATDQLTERDVDALVGKKIVPAQKAAMLSLAKSNRKAFDEIVAATPDLNLGEKIIPSDPTPKSSLPTPSASAGESLDAKIQASWEARKN